MQKTTKHFFQPMRCIYNQANNEQMNRVESAEATETGDNKPDVVSSKEWEEKAAALKGKNNEIGDFYHVDAEAARKRIQEVKNERGEMITEKRNSVVNPEEFSKNQEIPDAQIDVHVDEVGKGQETENVKIIPGQKERFEARTDIAEKTEASSNNEVVSVDTITQDALNNFFDKHFSAVPDGNFQVAARKAVENASGGNLEAFESRMKGMNADARKQEVARIVDDYVSSLEQKQA